VSYRTLARSATHEDVVLGSRFIAVVAPVAAPAAAEALLADARGAHPAASHHCWAYRIGLDQRFSDDGEPGGTAGRPMLEVLLKRDLDCVAAVVVRYFGGRKLGAGGLARAYGGAVARAVTEAGERWVEATRRLRIRAPFAQVDALLRVVDGVPGAVRDAPSYDEHGVVVSVRVPAREVDRVRALVQEASRGEARCKLLAGGPDDEGAG